MSILAICDGDFWPYAIGFAGQKNKHNVIINGEDGVRASFVYKKELKQWLKDNNLTLDDVTVNTEVEADPVNHVLHSVKISLEAALAATGADRYQVYLQGDNNFRIGLATILPYKSGRPTTKPVHYEAIREYLIKYWNAEVIHGMETDDKLSSEQTKDPDNTFIITADKDLNTVKGWKYNIKKGIKYYVNEEDALLWQYCQSILGDKIDAIQGIKGTGLIGTYKLFKDCETEEDLHYAALCAYEQSTYEKPFEALLEMMRLLFMVRELDDKGNPIMWEPYDCRGDKVIQSNLVEGYPVPKKRIVSKLNFTPSCICSYNKT